MSNSGLHNDHRKRMRQRFSKNGLVDFEDHEVLEMLLFSVIPRRNTNDISHELLDKFGSIHDVLSAGWDELCGVSGIGDTAAEQIGFFGEVYDRLSAEIFSGVVIDTTAAAGMYAMLRMSIAPADSASVAYIDEEGRIIKEDRLYRGKCEMTDDLPGFITECGAKLGAKTVLLMHNHKHEPLTPSPDDRHITYMLRREAEKAGIKNVMHVIVSDDGYIHI